MLASQACKADPFSPEVLLWALHNLSWPWRLLSCSALVVENAAPFLYKSGSRQESGNSLVVLTERTYLGNELGSPRTTARQVRALESQSCPRCEGDLPWVLVTAGRHWALRTRRLGGGPSQSWIPAGRRGREQEGRTPGSWDSDLRRSVASGESAGAVLDMWTEPETEIKGAQRTRWREAGCPVSRCREELCHRGWAPCSSGSGPAAPPTSASAERLRNPAWPRSKVAATQPWHQKAWHRVGKEPRAA